MSLLAYTLLALGAIITMANWGAVLRWRLHGKRTSLVPFVGGLLGFLGCVFHPSIPWVWGFVAFIVDPGAFVLPGLFALLVAVLSRVAGRPNR
jgi:hypothetical protein